MITVIHGSDQLTSRKYFLDQKDKESISFDAENLVLNELEQSIGGSNLFKNTKKIFIENLFSRKAAKNLIPIGSILEENQDISVFIWADREVGIKNLSSFPKYKSKNFKIPQNIWYFLDGLKPNNPTNVSMFHRTLDESDPQIIFAMIVRQFRLMIGLISNSNQNIDEVKRIAPWQKSKLVKQSSLFGKKKLLKMYRKLYKIDKSLKTGKSKLNLVQNIDIFLLEI